MRVRERPDQILAGWCEIIGSTMAPMTQAISFCDGILLVKVNNSTLYSLLNGPEKPLLTKKLRERFPQVKIHGIRFRLG